MLSDIQSESILLTGGASKLRGLRERIENKTKLKVFLPETAARSVAIGTGICFDYIKKIDEGLIIKSAYKI